MLEENSEELQTRKSENHVDGCEAATEKCKKQNRNNSLIKKNVSISNYHFSKGRPGNRKGKKENNELPTTESTLQQWYQNQTKENSQQRTKEKEKQNLRKRKENYP